VGDRGVDRGGDVSPPFRRRTASRTKKKKTACDAKAKENAPIASRHESACSTLADDENRGWHTRDTAILAKKRPTGETRRGRRGRFGAAGASRRTRELGHVLASHLLEPPSLSSGCGEAGLRVRDGRKARPLGLVGRGRKRMAIDMTDARARAPQAATARAKRCAPASTRCVTSLGRSRSP
jgi:hypothetical protein